MSTFLPANILFLPGITRIYAENIDKIFDQKFCESLPLGLNIDGKPVYDSLPSIFESAESWPQFINLCCYNCDCRIPAEPWFDTHEMFVVEGQRRFIPKKMPFCSEHCTAAYILRSYTEPAKTEQMYFLRKLYKEIRKRDVQVIPPSSDKIIRRKYCGEEGVTDEEYLAAVRKLGHLTV